MQIRKKITAVYLVVMMVLAGSAWAQNDSVGTITLGYDSISVTPEVPYGQLSITISGAGVYLQGRYGPDEAANLYTGQLPDDWYKYEIIASPHIEKFGLEEADELVPITQARSELAERNQIFIQRGTFQIDGGDIYVPQNNQGDASGQNLQGYLQSINTGIARFAATFLDFIVPSAAAADLSVESSTPTIWFDDTDDEAPTTVADWFIAAEGGTSDNDTFNTFQINGWVEGGTPNDAVPIFTLNHDGGTDTSLDSINSIIVDMNGDITFASDRFIFDRDATRFGIGTFTPGEDLHIQSTSPAIRLSDTTDGGSVDLGFDNFLYSIQGVYGNVVTIDSYAPDGTFLINEKGDVGIGTMPSRSRLQVGGDGGDEVQVLVRNDNTATPGAARKLFQIENADGPAKFSMFAGADEWAFNARTDVFRISKQGTGKVEMELNQNGNLTILGAIDTGSSRTIKHDITSVDTQKVLNQVLSMPVAEWTYNHDKGVRHMGPMSEDFHETFGLGDSDKKLTTIDTSGVALAAIQGLSKVVEEKDREIVALEGEIKTLRSEMSSLRAMVQTLAAEDKIALAD